MRQTAQHTFFFSDRDCFSNWYRAPFTFRDIQFNCVEQFMMYAKARTFSDVETASKILAATHPKDQKRLGREVKGYVDKTWNLKRKNVVYVGAREKFNQNPSLRDLLLSTAGTLLVEASPYDGVWGIKMGQNDPGVDDPANWKGQNLLGQVLTRLRDDMLLDLASAPSPVRSHSP